MNLGEPSLSVVIASHNAGAAIGHCLDALMRQRVSSHVEIIVADSSTDGTDWLVRERFPQVRLLHFESPLTCDHRRHRPVLSHGRRLGRRDTQCARLR
jgi:glycosyltransferase involved in cell wall biosynthesis